MDDLDRKIRDLLIELELPHGAWEIGRVREDVDIAIEAAATPRERLRLTARKAGSLVKTADRLLKIAADHDLAACEDLRVVRRLKRLGEIDLLRPAVTGPDMRPWLHACCLNFLDAWRGIAQAPGAKPSADGVWDWGRESPAMAFLVRCCQLVDEDVNSAAIKYAFEKAEPDTSEEERAAAYEAWRHTPLAKKLFEPDD
jgi:hypothetical protein